MDVREEARNVAGVMCEPQINSQEIAGIHIVVLHFMTNMIVYIIKLFENYHLHNICFEIRF